MQEPRSGALMMEQVVPWPQSKATHKSL